VLPLDDGVGDFVSRKVQLLRFGFMVRGSGFKLQGSDFGVSEFRVQASACRVLFLRKVQLVAQPHQLQFQLSCCFDSFQLLCCFDSFQLMYYFNSL